MNFDEFDEQMRQFELSLDQIVEEGIYIVTRLDGRGFTRLTKDLLNYERPFDILFHNTMCDTLSHLMQCGFNISYGYTQSDEISLLFRLDDDTFNRKVRKINTVLAGEASGVFSLAVGKPVVFDCRVVPLPSQKDVIDYFRWRQTDARRNALSAYCYWTLREEGNKPRKASKMIDGLTQEDKKKLLAERDINFDQCPDWQRNGAGYIWELYEKQGVNPVTGETETAQRRRVSRLENLPPVQELPELLTNLMQDEIG